MEFGEGLNKLKRYTDSLSPLQPGSEDAEQDTNKWIREFERDASAVLEFVYSTQLENAACKDTRELKPNQEPRCHGAFLVWDLVVRCHLGQYSCTL